MFVSPAFAQSSAAGGGGDMMMTFLPLILIFAVFYFLLIRPQQKKMKAHREMLGALRRGDRVATSGGIIGVVTRVGEGELTVEIAEGVRVKVLRHTVSDILQRTEPAGSDDSEDDTAEVDPAPAGERGGRRKRRGGNMRAVSAKPAATRATAAKPAASSDDAEVEAPVAEEAPAPGNRPGRQTDAGSSS